MDATAASPKKLSIMTIPLVDLLGALIDGQGGSSSSSSSSTGALMEASTLMLTSLQGTPRHPDYTPTIRAAIQKFMDARPSTEVHLHELEQQINRMRLEKLVACLMLDESCKAFPWAARAVKLLQPANHTHWEQLHQRTHRRFEQQNKALTVLRKASVDRFLMMRATLEGLQLQLQSLLGLHRDAMDARIPVAALEQLHQQIADIQMTLKKMSSRV